MSDSNSGRHFASPSGPSVPSQLPNGWDITSASVPNGSAKAAPGSTEEFMIAAGGVGDVTDPASFGTSEPHMAADVPASQPLASPKPEIPVNVAAVSSPEHAPAPAAPATPAADVTALGAPVNPLVAARAGMKDPDARRKSPAAPKAAEELYPIAEHPGTAQQADGAGKAFDTSFGDGTRKTRRTVTIVLVVVLALVLVAAVAFFVIRAQERSSAARSLDAAIERISDADEVIAPLDEAIASELSTSDVSEALTNAMMTSTTATNALAEASSQLDDAAKGRALLTDEQASVLDAARASVSARRDMLEVGRKLLTVDAQVSRALQSLDSAYAGIADANDKVQQSEDAYLAYSAAVAANEDASQFDLWANVDLDNTALTDITNAQASVAQAKEDFADADYSALETYLAARVTALQLLVQYDTCVANGDDAGAEAVLDQYNAANDAMNAAAANVPADGATLVRDAYAAATADQSGTYEQARSTCADNDATIRAYLGNDDAPRLSDSAAAE